MGVTNILPKLKFRFIKDDPSSDRWVQLYKCKDDAPTFPYMHAFGMRYANELNDWKGVGWDGTNRGNSLRTIQEIDWCNDIKGTPSQWVNGLTPSDIVPCHTFNCESTLTARATLIKSASAQLNCESSLITDGQTLNYASLTFNSEAKIIASPTLTISGSVRLECESRLIGSASQSYLAQSTFRAFSSLSAQASKDSNSSVIFRCSSRLIATADTGGSTQSFAGCSNVPLTLYVRFSSTTCVNLNLITCPVVWNSSQSRYEGDAPNAGGFVRCWIKAPLANQVRLEFACNADPTTFNGAMPSCSPFSASWNNLTNTTCCGLTEFFNATLTET